jgi:hypothetical protein
MLQVYEMQTSRQRFCNDVYRENELFILFEWLCLYDVYNIIESTWTVFRMYRYSVLRRQNRSTNFRRQRHISHDTITYKRMYSFGMASEMSTVSCHLYIILWFRSGESVLFRFFFVNVYVQFTYLCFVDIISWFIRKRIL